MKRSRLNPVSKSKNARKSAELYKKTKALYLKDKMVCEVEGCGNRIQDLHHKAGRLGSLKWYPAFFMGVCRKCHDRIEFGDRKWADEKGYKIRLNMQQHTEEKAKAMEWAESKGLL